MKTSISTRRQFICAAGTSILAPTIVSAQALGRGTIAPSDRVNVGIIGSGGRAVFETRQYPSFDNVVITAVCDAQETRRKSAREALEKQYAAQRPGIPNRGIHMYADFRELLAQKDIDAVYIAAPDHWHVSLTIAALKAGKHVHCEKPLGVSIEQDLAALKAVKASGKVFQYGAERRSTAEARKGIELIANGRIGKVEKIYVVAPPSLSGGSPTPVIDPPPGFDYDMWLGPAPKKPFCADRCLEGAGRNGIFVIYDYTLGNIANWAAHPLDQVQWWADHADRKLPPVHYEGTGKIPSEGLFDVITNWDVRCTYQDGLVLHMVDSDTYTNFADAPHPQMPFGRPGVTAVHNGAVFMGSKGWAIVSYEKVVFSDPRVMDSEITASEIHLPDTALKTIPQGMPRGHQQEATAGHHQNWIRAIRGEAKAVGDIEGAVHSDLISQLCDLAIRTGQPVRWDPRNASKFKSRPMRAPWETL